MPVTAYLSVRQKNGLLPDAVISIVALGVEILAYLDEIVRKIQAVSLTAGCPLKTYRRFSYVGGEAVDLQEANGMNIDESNETNEKNENSEKNASATLTTKNAAPSDQPTVASVAGESSPQSSKFCSECGAKISAKAEVCPKCGARLAASSGGEHNKTTAALLALFLGGIGAHKFYLGRTGMGLLYLFCCWTLIPALISLVEGIQFLSMSESEFSLKYR